MSARTSNAIEEVSVAQRIFQRAQEEAEKLRRFPESTYRLQFHKGFTFRDATAIVPYLRKLGVTHVYASPYLKARPGSTHGYDVIDHGQLNPELGTQADFEAFLGALQREGLSHILDTVPNHAGVGTNDNGWWNDVLEFGEESRFAGYFDIAWRGSPRPELHGKVLLPVLGEAYAAALEGGKLKLGFEGGAFFASYGEQRFPIRPCTYSMICQEVVANHPVWTALIKSARRVSVDSATPEEQYEAARALKEKLGELERNDETISRAIYKAVELFNGVPGKAASFDLLDHLLMEQAYRLTFWKNASDEINYRRFFDINDLAALNMQRPEVFEATHRLTLSLAAAGSVTGLRIDHPDGLQDPAGYFRDLQRGYLMAVAERVVRSDVEFAGLAWGEVREQVRELIAAHVARPRAKRTPGDWPMYVLGEKILAVGEPLPTGWAVHGTSGYDFLIEANSLYVDPSAEDALSEVYQKWTGDETSYDELVYRKKRLILETSLASELQMLAYRLDRVAQMHRSSRDFTHSALRVALKEVIACFPVYRTYVCEEGSCAADAEQMDKAIACVRERNPGVDPAVLAFIRTTVLHDGPAGAKAELRQAQREFASRFQQLTAPVTAKGVEDTAFYLYNRFVSLNEVGGEPSRFGIEARTLHAFLEGRAAHWPYAMNALSTHDTKRSEDLRARLNVLSEIPEEWGRALEAFDSVAARHRATVDGVIAPSRNDEYLIYQTLLGVWPAGEVGAEERESCRARVQAYLQKAMREGKVSSSWGAPNEAYEEAVSKFIAEVLEDAEFRRVFEPLLEKVARFGRLNSLSQTLLRLTAPGVPDTYQGMELWDLSLVDPDNRRPVDYGRREAMLEELVEGQERLTEVARNAMKSLEDGRAKMLVTWRALTLRRDLAGLFTEGEYEPVEAVGQFARNGFAFLRYRGARTVLVVAPRLFVEVEANGWGDTTVDVPRASWRNVLTGERMVTEGPVRVGELLGGFPVGLFIVE